MDNPIRYGDLFDSTLKTDIQGLYDDLNKVKTSLVKMVNEAKVAAGELRDAVNNGKETKPKGLDETLVAYQKVVNELKKVEAEMAKLKASSEAMASLQDKMNNAVSSGASVNDRAVATYESLKKQLDALQKVMKNMTQEELDNTSAGANFVAQANDISKAMKDIQSSMKGMEKTSDGVRNTLQSMGISFDSVSGNVVKLKGIQESLILTDKEMARVQKLGSSYAVNRADSYNALSQKYSVLKVLINQLTQEERENTEEGRKMVAQSKEIYEQMNAMQIATGKHQLQVGDYTKAFNGLNLATQQVVRELPVMAFGFDRFIMAISNNLPIFDDALRAAKEQNKALEEQKKKLLATGEASDALAASKIKIVSVGKQLIQSLLSWQTMLVVIISLLPSLIKKLEETFGAQRKLNEEVLKGIEYGDAYLDTIRKTRKMYVDEETKLRTLYRATQDINRSEEERLEIAKLLIENFKEEFEGYDALAIVQGKAAEQYDKVTEAMMKQAKMQAYLEKLKELEKKRIDIDIDISSLRAEIDLQQRLIETYEKKIKSTTNPEAKKQWRALTVIAKENIKDYNEQIQKLIKGDATAVKSIQKLENQLKLGDFRTLVDSEKEKEDIKSTKDYTEEAIMSNLRLIEEEEEREVAISNRKYYAKAQALEKYLKEQLAKEKNAREINEEQEIAIRDTISNTYEEAQMKEEEIRAKYAEKREEILVNQRNKDLEIEREARELFIKAHTEGMEQEIALNNLHYNNLIEDKRAYYNKQSSMDEEERELTVKGLKDLSSEIESLETIRGQKVLEIRKRWEEKAQREWEAMVREHNKKWKKEFSNFSTDVPGYYAFTKKVKDPELGVDINPKRVKPKKETSLISQLFGFKGDDADQVSRRYLKALEKSFNMTFQYMQKWMDMRMEMAHIAVESAEKEANSAKDALDIEQQARANGYAHNVGLARKEYEEKLKVQQEAMAEEQRLARIQQQIDAAQQASSLLVATANLWANISKMGIPGIVLAGIATASMFGAFAAAQVKAGELVKTKKYGEGMSEYLDYGGSHASGNDIDFGTMKDGTKRRVEKGEMVAVINKRNVSKYGVDGVADVISSLNSGTFEDKYGLAFAGLGLMNAGADLTKVEDGIDTLVKQGEKRVMEGNGYRVEYYKNRKRIIKN